MIAEIRPSWAPAGAAIPSHERLQGEAEELKTFLSTADRFKTVGMKGEGGDDGQVRIDGMPDRYAGSFSPEYSQAI